MKNLLLLITLAALFSCQKDNQAPVVTPHTPVVTETISIAVYTNFPANIDSVSYDFGGDGPDTIKVRQGETGKDTTQWSFAVTNSNGNNLFIFSFADGLTGNDSMTVIAKVNNIVGYNKKQAAVNTGTFYY